MQLTGPECNNRNIIVNADPTSIRYGSYDLSVDYIVVCGKQHQRSISLEPQEMAVLVSKERIMMPTNLVGYALPKTSLCQEGILSLSTGIIDPGYNGRVSTTIINFGKRPFTIKPSEKFLRLVVHELHGQGPAPAQAIAVSDRAYLAARKADTDVFPETFMDIPRYVDKVLKDVKDQAFTYVANRIVITFTILAAGIAVLAYIQSNKVEEQKAKIEVQSERIKQLESSLDEMKSLLKASKKGPNR